MKRIMTLCLLMAMAIGSVKAQKGMQGVGLNLGPNVDADGDFGVIGGGLKYQYNLTDYLRLEPSFTYYLIDYRGIDITGFINLDIFFLSPRAVRPYFFVGIGIMDDGYHGEVHFGPDAGLGLDWRITHNLSLQIEGGGMISVDDDDCLAAKFNIGLTYNF